MLDFFLKTPLLQLLLIMLVALFSCAKVTLQSFASRAYIKSSQDSLFFNFLFFVCVVLSLLLFFPMASPTPIMVLSGLVMSISTIVYQVFYSVALTKGPVSLTAMIVNFNTLITTALSIIVFRENVYLSHILGMILLIFSIILCRKDENSEGTSKTALWFVLTIVTMLSCGIGSFLQKLYAVNIGAKIENSTNTFLLFMYIFSAVFAYLIYIFSSRKRKKKYSFSLKSAAPVFALLLGVCLAIFQKLNIECMRILNGSFFFPTYAGIQSVFVCVSGIIFFGDKLSKKQFSGLLLGIFSIILMNCKFLLVL